jgi:hypothetical protein
VVGQERRQLPFGAHEHVAAVVEHEGHVHDGDVDMAGEDLTRFQTYPGGVN